MKGVPDSVATLLVLATAFVSGAALADPVVLREADCAHHSDAGRYTDLVAAVRRVAPAVVRVVTSGSAEAQTRESAPWPLREQRTHAQWSASSDDALASGFLIDSDGIVLTSAHAVDGAQGIKVILADERRLDAVMVGLDTRTDVAVLKIAANGLPALPIGHGSVLCVGETVASLGAPFGLENSVSAGVVSAMPRFLPGAGGVPFIQSDVAINPGSSGGPLFNARGEVVGMNTMNYSPGGAYSGISFSLPIDLALQVASELRLKGHVTHALIGVRTQPLTPELATAFGLDRAWGAVVLAVEPGSPPAVAQLHVGDVILSIGKRPPMPYHEIQDRIASSAIAADLSLTVWRKRAAIDVTVRTFELPVKSHDSENVETHFNVARLGLNLADSTVDQKSGFRPEGVDVKAVSGASRIAGIRQGDTILSVQDQPVARLVDFDAALKARGIDQPVALLILRGAALNFISVGRPSGAQRDAVKPIFSAP